MGRTTAVIELTVEQRLDVNRVIMLWVDDRETAIQFHHTLRYIR
jgi:hypothetical protein